MILPKKIINKKSMSDYLEHTFLLTLANQLLKNGCLPEFSIMVTSGKMNIIADNVKIYLTVHV